jgi:hypothetical protein
MGSLAFFCRRPYRLLAGFSPPLNFARVIMNYLSLPRGNQLFTYHKREVRLIPERSLYEVQFYGDLDEFSIFGS